MWRWVWLLGLALAAPSMGAPRLVEVTGGGVAVAEADVGRWAWFVDAAGFDTVQVTLYADQPEWDSGALHFGDDAWGTLPGVRAEVAAAQARGLDVMVVLRVRLDLHAPHNRHLWHGMIWPREAELEAWFANYREFALWGAARAAELGADLLVIGHELNSMSSTVAGPDLPALLGYHLSPERTAAVVSSRAQCAARAGDDGRGEPDGARFESLRAQLAAEEATRRAWAEAVSGVKAPLVTWPTAMPAALAERRRRYEAFWRGLAGEVRAVFSGPVGYGANFDQFEEVGFWDALDFIAISSYFALRPLEVDDIDAALEDGWRAVAARVDAAAQRWQRPVVLHELGWSRKAGGTVRPYSYVGVEPIERGDGTLACIDWARQPDAPGERERALAALLRVVEGGGFASLRGFSLWKMTTEPGHRADEPFAVVLPPPFVDREADHGFVRLAADLLDALRARPIERAPRGGGGGAPDGGVDGAIKDAGR